MRAYRVLGEKFSTRREALIFVERMFRAGHIKRRSDARIRVIARP